MVLAAGIGLYAFTGGRWGNSGSDLSRSSNNVSADVNGATTPLLATSNPIQAASAPPALATATNIGPRIQFATPVHDFGTVKGGEVVKYSYVFTNTGDRLLEISDVHASCGCTTAGEWSKSVEPGKTGTIPIQFNSTSFTGPVGKTITVTCNDTHQRTAMLEIKGTVWRPIEVRPQFATLHVTADAPSNATTVRIINNLDEPLIVSNLHCTVGAFATELKTNQPGKEYDVVVKTVPPWPTNNVSGQVTLQTSSTQMSVVTFTAWANYQPTVMASPPSLMLPAGPLTNQQTFVVWIRNNGTNTLAVSDPAVDAKGVDVQLKEVQPGRTFTASLTFPAGFDIPQGQNVELTVKSNHPQYPVVRVPITRAYRPVAAAPP